MDEGVRLVHEEAIKPDSLYTRKPLEWFVGRFVKMAFQSADSEVEHMWVLVTNVAEDYLVGELDNDPVLVTHVKYGDRVTLSRVQIEAVDLSLEEWTAEVEHLLSQGDFFNRWLGVPNVGRGLEVLFEDGLTPRQALARWRDWMPDEDACDFEPDTE